MITNSRCGRNESKGFAEKSTVLARVSAFTFRYAASRRFGHKVSAQKDPVTPKLSARF
jgi:hypothetical protein